MLSLVVQKTRLLVKTMLSICDGNTDDLHSCLAAQHGSVGDSDGRTLAVTRLHLLLPVAVRASYAAHDRRILQTPPKLYRPRKHMLGAAACPIQRTD